ncbi:aldo/keto reductase [Methylobacterium radiotolerans]|uniref:aldo/keto reductase n=1 Tax=Methylobacterium radiotolerans TaxID=31998 RepID=UPI000975F0AE|nr:aldo/keto reductase [Methylobacterium radiotolerans]
MHFRKLGAQGLNVSALGLGCMGMSFAYGGYDRDDAIRTIHKAIDLGITFFDTAEVYGPFENEELLGSALKAHRGQVQIATKFGFKILNEGVGLERMAGVDSSPQNIRKVVDASLLRLKTDFIDLLYQHRVDPDVPIEDVVGTMADLVSEGKVRYLGLSEVSAETLRRAHAVHPISAVQSEYSLWSQGPEQSIFPVCQELSVGFVPYSPLGRGFLTGTLRTDDLSPDDFRHRLPRFQSDAIKVNNQLLAEFQQYAVKIGCTPAQLALAWTLHKGDFIVPIPGARRIAHLEDNVSAERVQLNGNDIENLAQIFTPSKVAGDRYTNAELSLVDK